jgi:hypothetical protein
MFHILVVIKYMEQNPIWQASSRSAGQEIRRLFCLHKSPPPVLLFSHLHLGFTAKSLKAFLVSPMHSTCLSRYIALDFIALICGKEAGVAQSL